MGETFDELREATGRAHNAVTGCTLGEDCPGHEPPEGIYRESSEVARVTPPEPVALPDMDPRCGCGRAAHVCDRWCTRCFRENGEVDLYMDVTDGLPKPEVPSDADEETVSRMALAWVEANAGALHDAHLMARAEWNRIRRSRNRESRVVVHGPGVVVAPKGTPRPASRRRPSTFELALRLAVEAEPGKRGRGR